MPSQKELDDSGTHSRLQETTQVFDPGKTEDVLIRNYDHQRGHDLNLVIRTQAGERVFRNRYYLQPGETVSECDILPSADYEIAVTFDNTQEASRRYQIDSSAGHTAVIEIGNGALSLSEGLHS
jgi:hypothetical protein